MAAPCPAQPPRIDTRRAIETGHAVHLPAPRPLPAATIVLSGPIQRSA
ncbi:hypothetical protein ACFOPN_21180 [Xanthomonas hyacinthi]